MDPTVPPPPRIEGGLGLAGVASPPTASLAEEELPTSTAPTTTTDVPNIPEPVHKVSSEEDIKMYGQKVHVHGSLATQVHQPAHVPLHHNPHGGVNYAKAAKEEMHEMHEHPRSMAAALKPGAKTGVEKWDEVEEELPTRGGKGHISHAGGRS